MNPYGFLGKSTEAFVPPASSCFSIGQPVYIPSSPLPARIIHSYFENEWNHVIQFRGGHKLTVTEWMIEPMKIPKISMQYFLEVVK